MAVNLRSIVADLPKAELHRHLEGSIRPSTIAEVARKHKLPLPTYDPCGIASLLKFTRPAKNLKAFLQPFIKVIRYCFVDKETVTRMTYEVIEDAALENIKYLELRFSVECMSYEHRLALDETMSGIIEGVSLAMRRHPISVGLIVSANRPPGQPPLWPATTEELARLAVKYAGAGVVGFDLSGLEKGWPASRFLKEINIVRDAGLGVTIHAGEDAGPEAVRDAIHAGACRIGHGVRVTRDKEVLQLAIDRNVCFEMCPTSNVLTRAVSSLESHPIRQLYEMGVMVTVNTDDPTICGVTLTDECVKLVESLGFSVEDVRHLVQNAKSVAFSRHVVHGV